MSALNLCLHCTNNIVSIIPYSIIEQWLLILLSESKQVESRLSDKAVRKNSMKMKQESFSTLTPQARRVKTEGKQLFVQQRRQTKAQSCFLSGPPVETFE